jgi:hypothetical protein
MVYTNDVAKIQWRLQALRHFVFVVCSWEFSCAHHGEADIKQQCDNTKSDTMG